MSRRFDIQVSVVCTDAETGRIEDATAKHMGNLTIDDVKKVVEVLLPFQAELEKMNMSFLAEDVADAA